MNLQNPSPSLSVADFDYGSVVNSEELGCGVHAFPCPKGESYFSDLIFGQLGLWKRGAACLPTSGNHVHFVFQIGPDAKMKYIAANRVVTGVEKKLCGGRFSVASGPSESVGFPSACSNFVTAAYGYSTITRRTQGPDPFHAPVFTNPCPTGYQAWDRAEPLHRSAGKGDAAHLARLSVFMGSGHMTTSNRSRSLVN